MKSTMNNMKPGEKAVITSLNLPPAYAQRMISLGMIPGEKITIIRKAPLMDPFYITAAGSSIAIRVSEAQLIEVDTRDE